ncbi:TRAP transporter small permease [Labrenzia sp. R4_2]|uniref:TRAP transporter small permease n=2 Tax=Hyphomicrobiales TaxID=356 RepID=UPI001AD9E810|nr:TRAP transporter small permease [Labrenzia sp. R4_2]
MSWLSELAVMISGVVMALMVAHVVLDVSLRYVIGVPLAGTTEIVSRYYMVTLIFLPIAFVQITDQHISASLISDMLSTRSRFLLDCLTSLLMAVFAMLLAWCAGAEALRATEITEQIQTPSYFLPTWPARWIPVLALSLVVIVSVLNLVMQMVRFITYGSAKATVSGADKAKVLSQ